MKCPKCGKVMKKHLMAVNPSRRLNKVFVVLCLSFSEENGDYDSVEIVYTTLDKTKADEIKKLWDIVEKERHHDDNKVMKAINSLKSKFGIMCWSGEEIRVEERELQ